MNDGTMDFRKALEKVINCYSIENGSNTPDFVLAQFLVDSLAAFDRAVQHRDLLRQAVDRGDVQPPPCEDMEKAPA